MTRNLRRLLLFIFLFLPGLVLAQRDPPVEQFELKSTLLGRSINYRILYPVQYQYPDKREKRFPVLYLLHGVTGQSSNWLEQTRVALYVTHYDLFIVMVEGGNGWYTDSATVPADKYESYILMELIPEVEKRFRVSQERAGRAVAGLSMGGYGAIKFGLKHPEMFALVASMSGAFGAGLGTEKDLNIPGPVRDSIQQTFGALDSPTRAANDVFKLVREVPAERIRSLPYIYLDCGTEDFLFRQNREFSDLLVERKIPHEYRQLPGSHSWQYWDQQLREILKLTAQQLVPPK
ncbi:MAG: alpha/beta hydrolase [Pyrinomonadaceae bacterium]